MLFAVLLPLPILIVQLVAPFALSHLESGLPTGGVALEALPKLALSALEVSAALYFGSVLIGLLTIFTVPRLCNFFLDPDRTYVLYGPHYALHRVVSTVSNSSYYNNLFGDSSAIVYYLRWIGYNLNQVVQTGSNFGSSQKHENPFLCNIGRGTMVSDAISLINMQMSSSAFRLRQIRIGSDNYFGNKVHYPPDGKTGANCLFGTKVLVPIDGPLREGVGLLGSPPFEIPRIVDRDLRVRQGLPAQAVQEQLRRKNRHNLVTAILFLLRDWLFLFALLFLGYIALDHYHRVGIVALWLFAAASIFLAILYFAVIERATLGFKRLRPRFVSIYDDYYWFHERHWKFCDLWFQLLFKGTPFKSLLMRLLGVRMGKKVFDDGCLFIEKTLATVGDYSNLNAGTTIQGHSLEEGVFKSDYIKIGRGCTIGCGAWVHYGVTMGDNALLQPDSFLMKGENPAPKTVWRGNPARLIGLSTADSIVDQPHKPLRIQPNGAHRANGHGPNGKLPRARSIKRAKPTSPPIGYLQ
jgi:non-ribosomal peptide synthetase-like protein